MELKQKMNLKQQLSLDPLQKYVKFNRPPYKAVIILVLVFFNTLQLKRIFNINIYKNENQFKQFVSYYFDPNLYMSTMFVDSEDFSIYNLQELNAHFQYIMNSWQNINQNALQVLNINNVQMTIRATPYVYQANKVNYQSNIFTIDISQGFVLPNSPFDINNVTTLKQFLLKNTKFDLIVKNIGLNYEGVQIQWQHTISYQFTQRAQINMNILFQPVTDKFQFPKQNLNLGLDNFLNALMIICSLISLLLNFRYFKRIVLGLYQYEKDIYISKNYLKQRNPTKKNMYDNTIDWLFQNQIPLRALSWLQWLEILDIWVIVNTFGNFLQLISTILIVFRSKSTLLIGFSCLLSWIVLVKFFKQNKRMALLNQVLSRSIPRIIVFLVQFFPVFMAFVVFASTAFWKVTYFSSVRRTIATQMALLLGDSVCIFTISIMQFHSSWIAIYYTFSYVLLFVYGIHNLLVGLIKQQFVLNRIILQKRQLKQDGYENYVPVYEVKLERVEQRQKLPIKFSKTFQQSMIRKILKGNQDRINGNLQRTFMISEQEIKIIIRDYDQDIKYSYLTDAQIVYLKKQLISILISIVKRTQKLSLKHKRIANGD